MNYFSLRIVLSLASGTIDGDYVMTGTSLATGCNSYMTCLLYNRG